MKRCEWCDEEIAPLDEVRCCGMSLHILCGDAHDDIEHGFDHYDGDDDEVL